ncbi:hypothetical protein O0S10_04050, partial [Methanocorpusculum sp. MG]
DSFCVFRKPRSGGIPCFFSVEFRVFSVFRGYSKQKQSKKAQKTFSTRNITEKVIWQNPQQLNQKKGTPVPASTGYSLAGEPLILFRIQKNVNS